MRSFVDRGGLWVVAQMFLLVAVFGGPYFFSETLHSPWLKGFGVLIVVAGLVQMALGARALGRNLTPMPSPNGASGLKTTGIYGLARHPIYGGLILLAFGQALITRPLVTLPLAETTLIFFALKARYEEKWLRRKFDDYEAYAKRTKRFVPWIF